MRHCRLLPPAEDDPRRTRRPEAGGTREQRYGWRRMPRPREGRLRFEFDDIDIDVPLEELLVEASKDTPCWRVMLTPLPGASGEPDTKSTPGRGDRVIWFTHADWQLPEVFWCGSEKLEGAW